MRDDRKKDTPSDSAAAYGCLIVLGAVVGLLIVAWILWRTAHLLF
jgi:hypothetical protein